MLPSPYTRVDFFVYITDDYITHFDAFPLYKPDEFENFSHIGEVAYQYFLPLGTVDSSLKHIYEHALVFVKSKEANLEDYLKANEIFNQYYFAFCPDATKGAKAKQEVNHYENDQKIKKTRH
jgi:hypothetical protein